MLVMYRELSTLHEEQLLQSYKNGFEAASNALVRLKNSIETI